MLSLFIKTQNEIQRERKGLRRDSHMEEQREAISAAHLGSPKWIPAVRSDGDGNRDAEKEEVGDDSDFAFVPRDPISGQEVTADDIFSNGQIRTAFPLFGRELAPVIPMQGLAIKDRDELVGSASSSECDELEGVPEASYCVWAPERQVRSKSYGEPGRLRLRDIVQGRSRSDGNKKFLFLAPPPPPPPVVEKEKEKSKGGSEKKGKVGKVTELDIVTAHRLYYSNKGGEGMKGGKRSFLPYRPEFVGFFGNAANRSHF